MPQVTLYHAPRSRSLRARWLLEELGVPYEVRLLDLDKGDHKRADYLALNPMGKVPTVVVDGHPVWESPAIVAHLCDLFPEAGLAPAPGTAERADFYRWLSFATAVMEPAFMELRRGDPADPRQVGWGDFASVKAALAQGLDGRAWLVGGAFSGADLMVGGNLAWFMGWAPEAFGEIPGVPAYVERVRARPAYWRAGEIDALG
jgi:glutathione S-transferase